MPYIPRYQNDTVNFNMWQNSEEYCTLLEIIKSPSHEPKETQTDAGKVRGWLRSGVWDAQLPSWVAKEPLLVELFYRRHIYPPDRYGVLNKIFSREIVFDNLLPEPRSAFLGLPLELRDIIYEYTMDDLPTFFVLDGYSIRFGGALTCVGRLPSISFANRQTLWESTLVYLRRTQFVLMDYSTSFIHWEFLRYLLQFPSRKAIDAVRRLSYHCRHRKGIWSLMAFRGLKFLSIGFDLPKEAFAMDLECAKAKDWFRAQQLFWPIYELPLLKELWVRCNTRNEDTPKEVRRRAYTLLFKVVCEGFEERSRKVKIRMRFPDTLFLRRPS
jgi:hypothetical protein